MFRRTGLASVLAVAACWGQNYPNQQRLQQVTAWKGTVKIALTASQVVEPSVDNAKFSANDLTVFTVNLGQVEAEWIGTATGTYTVDETLTSSTVCDGVLHGVGSWAVSTSWFSLGFDVDSDTFSLLFVFPSVLTMNLTDTSTCFGVTTTSTRPQQLVWLALGDEQGLPIPATGFALQGSKDVKGTSAMGFEVDYTITWDLTPSTKDLEVVVELGGYDDWRPTATWDATIPGNTIPVAVVEPDGYLDWRPTATRDATMPGNTIPVKATLRYTDGTSPQIDADKAQKFIFELLETSQEPGIAMNWPRDASDKDYDLRFAPANAIAFDDPTARQRAEFVPASPQTTASITIQSFDWGGWSRLKVTAELPGPGGRTITGHLLGDETQTEVRLPKRSVSSRIADAWKVAHKGITAADSSDDEGLPAGDGNSGDGLTLYEEYRGFYENQVHIEGDPTKKDYFAVNLAGKAGDGGLALFQTISGMAVHSELLQTELSFDRVINKNVRAAPHRVDQHGVIVKVQASFVGFALAVPLKPGDPASTPKGFQYIGLPIVLPQRSTSQADVSYASSAVAHELLHTVNVYHHGEGDREAVVWTRGPGGTVLEGGTTAIRVFREDGTDVTAHVLVDIDKFPDPKKPFTRWLGVHNGQHSGFEDCVMRYDHAEAYQSDADSSVRYTVGEIPGAHLCDTVTGVGINDPGRSPPNGPQSRYGSAIPPRGACKRQILVNDAVPPPTR